jgi:AP2 domain
MNTYEIVNDEYSKLIISGNKNNGMILVDTKDVTMLRNHSWYIKDSNNDNHYVACKMNGKTIKLHRFLLGVTERKIIVDHLDGNTFNNRRKNLRKTNSTMNNLNCKFSKNNTSGRTGVRYSEGQGNRSAYFEAQYRINGKSKTKRFSVKKYGYDEAFRLVEQFREEFERENNVLTSKTFNDYRNHTC